ncbi:MAG: ferritin-like domain-containing protein [Candidatus Binatia bacterium]
MEPHELKESQLEQEIPVNRTGIMTHPELSAELIQGAKETAPSSEGDAMDMAAARAEYLAEALPVGSPPVVLEVSEDGENLGQHEGLALLLDKLGERLAFERQGTRLYQAFLQKYESLNVEDGAGPSHDELQHICEEELEHFKLLQKAITKLGGDATVQTPSADVAGVLSHGVLQIVGDPRTTLSQTLQAMLNAELVDNDGWQLLQEVAAELGQNDLEELCGKAIEEEQEHLEKVREWLLSMTLDQASAMDEDDLEEDEGNGAARKEAKQSEKRTKSPKPKSSRSSTAKKKKKK